MPTPPIECYICLSTSNRRIFSLPRRDSHHHSLGFSLLHSSTISINNPLAGTGLPPFDHRGNRRVQKRGNGFLRNERAAPTALHIQQGHFEAQSGVRSWSRGSGCTLSLLLLTNRRERLRSILQVDPSTLGMSRRP